MGTGAAGRDPDAGSRTAANTGGATGATVGSVQNFQIQSHGHNLLVPTVSYNLSSSPVTAAATNSGNRGGSIANTIDSSGGGESRPQNANVEYIIKV
jgi:hypothetical protein